MIGKLRFVMALQVALLCVLPGPAFAWGSLGHQTTAQIAEANITPQTRAKLHRLFAAEPLLGTRQCRVRNIEEASIWPDCIRAERWRWGYTFAWHYRTAPICEPYDPWANCSGGNCVTAQIDRNFRLLADERLPAHIRLEALAFLVHFAGDIHQPLHSGDDHDRGGNDRKVDYGLAKDENLHAIWDTMLAERAITSANPPLVRRYSASERAGLAGGTPADWGRESWKLARDFVYPMGFDGKACGGKLPVHGSMSEKEIEASLPLVRKRIEQAGLRIADMLDKAFLPGPLPEALRR